MPNLYGEVSVHDINQVNDQRGRLEVANHLIGRESAGGTVLFEGKEVRVRKLANGNFAGIGKDKGRVLDPRNCTAVGN